MILTWFNVLSDFNGQSRNGATCSVSGLPRTPADEGMPILRGPAITAEGFFDVRPSVICETAGQLGMIPAEEAERLRTECAEFLNANEGLGQALTEANMRLEQLILQNAELITERDQLRMDKEDLQEAAWQYEDLANS